MGEHVGDTGIADWVNDRRRLVRVVRIAHVERIRGGDGHLVVAVVIGQVLSLLGNVAVTVVLGEGWIALGIRRDLVASLQVPVGVDGYSVTRRRLRSTCFHPT